MSKISNINKELVATGYRAGFSNGIGYGVSYANDIAIIALGRLFKKIDPDFFERYLSAVQEASEDYGDIFNIDALENKDNDLWWSGKKLDDEIRLYLGDTPYPEFKDRYHKK